MSKKKVKILIFAQETGSALTLIPLVDSLSEKAEIDILALEPALKIFKQNFNNVFNWTQFKKNFKQIGSTYNLILSGYGHPKNKESLKIFKISKKSKIFSIAILDNWKGIERFFKPNGDLSTNLPNHLLVMDKFTKNELVSKGYKANEISIIGHPLLYKYKKKNNYKIRKDIRKKLGARESTTIYFLASEIIHNHNYWQKCKSLNKNKCQSLFNATSSGEKIWKKILKNEIYEKDFLFIIGTHPNEKTSKIKGIKFLKSNTFNQKDLISAVDVVFGLSSFFLIQSNYHGKKSYNISAILDEWEPKQSFLNYNLWNKLYKKGLYGEDISLRKKTLLPNNNFSLKKSINKILSLSQLTNRNY